MDNKKVYRAISFFRLSVKNHQGCGSPSSIKSMADINTSITQDPAFFLLFYIALRIVQMTLFQYLEGHQAVTPFLYRGFL